MRGAYISQTNLKKNDKKKKTRLTSIFISGAGNIHGGLQLNPEHFSQPAAETAKQGSPETRHKNDFNGLYSSTVFIFTITRKLMI